MAIGSVIADIQQIVALGFFTYRPAVGVEALIKGASGEIMIGTTPNKAADIYLELKKVGVGQIKIINYDETSSQIIAWGVLLNNDFDISVHNHSGSTQHIGFWGIQTK